MVFRLDILAEMCYCIVTKDKLKTKGQVIRMTMKTKRNFAIGSGATLCAALALLIAMRTTPENEQIIPSVPETVSSVKVDISAPGKPQPENIELVNNIHSNDELTSQPEIDIGIIIENGDIELPNTEHNTPPDPPKIEDEMPLTNTDTEPTHTPEQVQPNKPTASNTPKHGDTKDGMIYINGFGWVKDEGGGGRGETASDMYENGNKIGFFG